ncbi:patatin-like phospholipase family protein [Bauldia sp.]|uniref:patatin-like phospholipase family protein n=1 Tax=Bauldia sp. TaxID=2575872 RepID=UPI003BAD5B46
MLPDQRDGNDPTIGLALGGGAAQGFAHVSVLEALDEMGVRPTAIVATSMGAVIGAAYAAGMSGADIRHYVTDLLSDRSRFISRLWQLRPRAIREISIGLGQSDLERVLESFLPDNVPEAMSALPISFKTVATDYYSGDEVVIERGPLIRAIAASAAVPLLFRPVVAEGRVLVDGGLSNPVPFDRLSGVDFVIAADVITEPTGTPSRVPGAIESLFGAASLLMRALMMEKAKGDRKPDVLIRLPTTTSHILDFTKAIAIMEESATAKDAVKRTIESALRRQDAAA